MNLIQPAGMEIETISEDNIKALAELFHELWPDDSLDAEYEVCKTILHSDTQICYLVKEQERYIAFIYLTLRTDYVEGATASPVAYVEGLYVKPAFRKQGIGRKLLNAGEEWGKAKGCTQFASDAELHNADSIAFHKQYGFEEANRVVSFIKEL